MLALIVVLAAVWILAAVAIAVSSNTRRSAALALADTTPVSLTEMAQQQALTTRAMAA